MRTWYILGDRLIPERSGFYMWAPLRGPKGCHGKDIKSSHRFHCEIASLAEFFYWTQKWRRVLPRKTPPFGNSRPYDKALRETQCLIQALDKAGFFPGGFSRGIWWGDFHPCTLKSKFNMESCKPKMEVDGR